MNPIVYTVLDLLAKSAGILLLGWSVQSLWRSASAAQRCLVWLACFTVLLLLPLTVFLKPLWTVSIAEEKAAPASAVATSPAALTPESTLAPAISHAPPSTVPNDELPLYRSASAPAAAATAAAATATAAIQQPMEKRFLRFPSMSVGAWVGLTWATGAAGLLLLRMVGALQLRRLHARSRVCGEPRFQQMMQRHAAALGVRRTVDLRLSDRVTVPLTWGLLKPVLLLPESALRWTDAQVDAALCHELGHIRHWDALSHGFMAVLGALHWPNPLLWAAAKSWRLAQEQACDDLVLDSGAATQDYAMQLLNAARSVRRFGLLHAAALTMAVPSTLETRLTAIMDGTRDRRPMRRQAVLAGAASVLGLLALCAALQVRAATPEPKAEPTLPLSTLVLSDRPAQVWYDMRIAEFPADVTVPQGISSLVKDAKPAVMREDQLMLILADRVPGMLLMDLGGGIVHSGQERLDTSASRKIKDPNGGAETFEGVHRRIHITDEGPQIHVDVSALYNKMVPGQLGVVQRSARLDQRIASGETVLIPFAPATGSSGPDKRSLYLMVSVRQALLTQHLSVSADKIEYATPERARGVATGHVTLSLRRAAPLPGEMDGACDLAFFDLEKDKVELLGRPCVTLKKDRYVGTAGDTKFILKWDADTSGPIILGGFKREEVADRPAPPAAPIPGEEEDSAAARKLREITLPVVQFREVPISQALDFLRGKAREFDLGEPDEQRKGIALSSTLTDTNKDTVINLYLHDVPLVEALRYTTSLANLKFRIEAGGVLVYPAGQEPVKAKTPEDSLVERKLRDIILPLVQLREAPLAEALDYLHEKAREYDEAEKDESKKGVVFTSKIEKEKRVSITLDLRNVPLIEALRYLTELANVSYRIEAGGVVIEPKNTKTSASQGSSAATAKLRDIAAKADALRSNEAVLRGKMEDLQKEAALLKSQSVPGREKDPVADDYYRAYVLYRDAEKLHLGGEKEKARGQYAAAQALIEAIARQHPNWQPDLVKYRLRKIQQALEQTAGAGALPPAPAAASATPASAEAKGDWAIWPTTVTKLQRMDEVDDRAPLASGDCLSFRIVEEGDHVSKLRIPTRGMIFIPYLGEVKLVGMTPRQACASIKAALEKGHYFKTATVLMAVEYLPPRGYFTVRGEVKRHGRYEIGQFEMPTLADALERSGGFTEDADREHIHLHTPAKSFPGSKADDIVLKYDQITDPHGIYHRFPLMVGSDIVVDKKAPRAETKPAQQ